MKIAVLGGSISERLQIPTPYNQVLVCLVRSLEETF